MKQGWIIILSLLLLASPVWANEDGPLPEYQPPPEYEEQYNGPDEPYDEYYEPPPRNREPKRIRRRHKAKRILRKVRKVLDVIESFVDHPEAIEGFLK